MPSAARPNAQVHYHVTDADASSPTVVLGHGFLMTAAMFDRLAPAAATAGVRLVTWDARGHGATTAHGPFDYWDLARDALAVLDDFGIERAVVGGLSQGGYSALRMALTAPERVSGLVLMDTEAAACTPEDVEGYRELFGAWFDRDVPIKPLAHNLAPRLIGGTDADQQPWISAWLNEDRTRWRDAAEALMTRDCLVERLGEITCPALVLRGEHDHNCTPAKAQLLADALPGADPVCTIAGAGHGSAWTHPGPVAQAIFDFVGTHTK